MLLISALVVGCYAIPASASSLMTTVTTGCTTPACVAAGLPADTFNNIVVTQGTPSPSTSYTDVSSGIVFSDSLGLVGVMGSALGPNPGASGWPSGTAITSGAGVSTMTITLPGGVNAIDFYVGMQNYNFFTISITDSSGGTFTSGSFEELGNPIFFGASTTSTFNSFTITSQGSTDQITLDKISWGSSGSGGDDAQTPEAATLLLVAAGLFLMRFAGRWMPGRTTA
jgi:hypothetical protein